MTGFRTPFPVDSASCDNRYICSVFYIEIIVYNIHTFFSHYYRNVNLLFFCFTAYINIDSLSVLFRNNLNMTAVPMTNRQTVQSEVICPFLFKSIRIDHIKHLLCHNSVFVISFKISAHKVRLLFVFCIRMIPVSSRTRSERSHPPCRPLLLFRLR